MLLVGAGLSGQELHASTRCQSRFQFLKCDHHAHGFQLPGKYPSGAPRAQMFQQAVDKIKTVPGVESQLAAVLSLPLGGDSFNVGRSYIREGRPATPEESANAAYLVITPDYFRAMQIPLTEGRAFTDQDNDKSPKVVIVNQAMARAVVAG